VTNPVSLLSFILWVGDSFYEIPTYCTENLIRMPFFCPYWVLDYLTGPILIISEKFPLQIMANVTLCHPASHNYIFSAKKIKTIKILRHYF
jgi:hypothetical protein